MLRPIHSDACNVGNKERALQDGLEGAPAQALNNNFNALAIDIPLPCGATAFIQVGCAAQGRAGVCACVCGIRLVYVTRCDRQLENDLHRANAQPL